MPVESQEVEGAGEGEFSVEEAVCRFFSGQCRFERGIPGKLLGPSSRRDGVFWVCENLSVSERRACRVLRQIGRPSVMVSGFRWKRRLVVRTIELARKYGRYGYRRITALLSSEGWNVNHKRVERTGGRRG